MSLTFLIIAILYSSVGFGGGSSYIALMLLGSISFEYIPTLALTCNLIVVTGGAYHFIRNGHVNWRLILPFVLTSIPCAYIGGSLHVEKDLFRLLLGICLLVAALRMIYSQKRNNQAIKKVPLWAALLLGSSLGFISGLVGIGGGIFLSPILYNLKWARAKEISSLCCLFIFFNSCSGLLGQIQKLNSYSFIQDYWPLLVSVFVGGQIGSYLGAKKLKPRLIELMTASLVLIVSLRILFFS